jgi:MFS transporter, ACS family, glucarate transporter
MSTVPFTAGEGASFGASSRPLAASAAGPTHTRFLILAMIFIVTSLNNADRATLSIAGSDMQTALGISTVQMGYLFSAFAWSYALAQLPGGWLMDRFGSKRTYAVSIFMWSLMTFAQGFAGSWGASTVVIQLFALRFLVGLCEGPAYPGNTRIVTAWFPSTERATASAIFNSGQYFATALFAPLMGWLTHSFGWQSVFYVMGTLGMLMSAVWMLVIHAPTDHPRINKAELDYMVKGGALIDMDRPSTAGGKKRTPTLVALKALLSSRMMLGVYLGQYGITTLVYFFLTWFPIYLVQALHMPILKAGFIAAIPAICGFVGGVLGGLFSDALLRRGWSLTWARKIPIVIGLLLSMSIVACNFLQIQWIIVCLMALAFFGKGLGSLGWAVVADTSPKEAAGISGGLFNTFANLAGITTPIVIGYIVQTTKSFDGALIYVACHAVFAICCFLFVTKEIKRIELKPAAVAA